MQEHIVVLRIKKECEDEPMNDTQVEIWVLQHFEGCDYGSVEVESVNSLLTSKGK